MEAFGLVAAAAGVVASIQLGSKYLTKGVQLLDHQFFSRQGGEKSATTERFRLVTEGLVPENAQVDVVFIHGLLHDTPWIAGDQKGQQITWHELPALRNAKVMTYYYDIALRSSEFLVKRTLFHETNQLLSRLVSQKRKGPDRERPIIFVAHSLGGILLQNALVSSSLSGNEDEQAIFKSTAGIIFLDTPRRGSANGIGEIMWRTVEPRLSHEQHQMPTWQLEEYRSRERSLAHDMGRFESIVDSLPNPPRYIGPGVVEYAGNDASEMWDEISEALREIQDAPATTSLHVLGHGIKRTQPGSDDSFSDFLIGTNMTDVGQSVLRRLFDDPSEMDLAILNMELAESRSNTSQITFTNAPYTVLENSSERLGTLDALRFAYECLFTQPRSSYESIFFIKASNQTSIGQSFLDIYRKILDYYSGTLGVNEAEHLLGVGGIMHMSDDDIVSSTEMLTSTVEAVVQWLGRPRNHRWLLIIDDMPMIKRDLGSSISNTHQTGDLILRLFLRSMLLLRYSQDSDCHIICTTRDRDTKAKQMVSMEHPTARDMGISNTTTTHGILDFPYGRFGADAFSIDRFWKREELGEVGFDIFNLCLITSDEHSPEISSQIFNKCSDLLGSTRETSAARMSVDDALRHLVEKGILLPRFGYRYEVWKVDESIRRKCRRQLQSKPDLPGLADKAWACLIRSATPNTERQDHFWQWDLGASLVENCSAAVRWCNEAKQHLSMQKLDLSTLGELCERHSEYSTAAALYESVYQRQRSVYRDAKITFRLARTYYSLKFIDKAERKCKETISLIKDRHEQLALDALQLKATLIASRGETAEATALLEDLLRVVEDSSSRDNPPANNSKKGHLRLLSVLRDLANNLARRGDYGTAISLIQRALLSQKQQKQQSQPTTLQLLDSMAALYRRQGELRQAERCYKDAQNLTDRWLGDRHPSAALRRAKSGIVVGLQGRLKEAVELFRSALKTARESLGAGHPDVCHIHENLILCLAADGHYDTALEELHDLENKAREAPAGINRPLTERVEHYKKELRTGVIAQADLKEIWLQALELVKDEIGGVGWINFAERQ